MRSLESLEEESDQASGVVAGVVVASDREVADAAHQLVWLRAGPDVVCLNRSARQLSALESEESTTAVPRDALVRFALALTRSH